jgi:predicted branched-subunit amino acid permease
VVCLKKAYMAGKISHLYWNANSLSGSGTGSNLPPDTTFKLGSCELYRLITGLVWHRFSNIQTTLQSAVHAPVCFLPCRPNTGEQV